MENKTFSIYCLLLTALQFARIGGSFLNLSLGFVDLSPEEVIAQKSLPLLLNCSGYSEAGPLQVLWYHQGLPIDDDRKQVLGNGSLFIEKVAFQKKFGRRDDGNYTCLLKNEVGVLVSRPIRVVIARMARQFTVEPEPLTTYEGGKARFSCQIHAVPPAVVSWFHNGQQLPHNDSRYTLLPSGTLQINDVTEKEAGAYQCQCSNVVRQRVSDAARLIVLPEPEMFQPPVFLSTSEPVWAIVNDSAVIECLVNSYPKPEISWVREDSTEIDSERVITLSTSNLLFLTVRMGDSGFYVCVAKSIDPETGNVVTEYQQTLLTVYEPPRFISIPESHIKPPAQTSRFECIVKGNPTPSIEWLKNGQPLFINGRIKLKDGHILVISQTVSSDSGIYQCVASNRIGVRTVAGRLQVSASSNQPKPPENFRAQTVSSSSIQLWWSPAVSPGGLLIKAYTVHYLPSSGGLEAQTVTTNTSQLIGDLKPYTNYTFYVRAYNKKSASEQSESVTERTGEDVPLIPPTMSLTSNSPTTLHVQWSELPLERARGIITGHRIHYRKHKQASYSVIDVPAAIREYTITGLTPTKLYDVRVMSGTKAGFPVLSDENWPWMTCEMPDVATYKVPMSPVMHLTVLNDTTLEVEWSIPLTNVNPVISFHLSYRQQGHPLCGPIVIPANNTKFLLIDLEPHTWYEVHLVAKNDNGESLESIRNIITFSGDNPDVETVEVVEPPHQLEAEPTSSSSIHLIWKTPETSKNISYYTVRFHPVIANGLVNESLILYIRSTNNEVVITDLMPFTLYEFSVRSHDVHNQQGPFSQKVECKTKEDLPSPPLDVTWTRVDANSVRLSWQFPQNPNGIIIAYHVLYNLYMDEKDMNNWNKKVEGGAELSALLSDLMSNTLYYVCMKAENSAGMSSHTPILPVKLSVRQNSSRLPSQEVVEEEHDPMLGVIVGVSIGIGFTVMCAIVIIYRNRCCPVVAQQPSSSSNGRYSMSCTYGYVPQTNGHIPGSKGKRKKKALTTDALEMESFTPMLSHIPIGRTDHLDTKGGYPTPNCNGLVNGHVRAIVKDSPEPNDRNNSSSTGSTQAVEGNTGETPVVYKSRARPQSCDRHSWEIEAEGDSSTVALTECERVPLEDSLQTEEEYSSVCSMGSARIQKSSCNTELCDANPSSSTVVVIQSTLPMHAASATLNPNASLELSNSERQQSKDSDSVPSIPPPPTSCSQVSKPMHRNSEASTDEDSDFASRPYSVNAFLSPLITPRFLQSSSTHSSTELT